MGFLYLCLAAVEHRILFPLSKVAGITPTPGEKDLKSNKIVLNFKISEKETLDYLNPSLFISKRRGHGIGEKLGSITWA
jgi:hypothetical protein